MRKAGCEQCDLLWAQFEAAVREHEWAASTLESSPVQDPELKERMLKAERARVETRQNILTHEKAAHADQTLSFA